MTDHAIGDPNSSMLALHVPVVGDAVAPFMTAPDTDPAALRAIDSLAILPADPAAASEEIQRRREEIGFSYFVFGAPVLPTRSPRSLLRWTDTEPKPACCHASWQLVTRLARPLPTSLRDGDASGHSSDTSHAHQPGLPPGSPNASSR
jgi:hypothetical protein